MNTTFLYFTWAVLSMMIALLTLATWLNIVEWQP